MSLVHFKKYVLTLVTMVEQALLLCQFYPSGALMISQLSVGG